MSQELEETIRDIAQRAKAASDALAETDTRSKDAWLQRVVERLEAAQEAHKAAASELTLILSLP